MAKTDLKLKLRKANNVQRRSKTSISMGQNVYLPRQSKNNSEVDYSNLAIHKKKDSVFSVANKVTQDASYREDGTQLITIKGGLDIDSI